jgi:hypothetical protein
LCIHDKPNNITKFHGCIVFIFTQKKTGNTLPKKQKKTNMEAQQTPLNKTVSGIKSVLDTQPKTGHGSGVEAAIVHTEPCKVVFMLTIDLPDCNAGEERGIIKRQLNPTDTQTQVQAIIEKVKELLNEGVWEMPIVQNTLCYDVTHMATTVTASERPKPQTALLGEAIHHGSDITESFSPPFPDKSPAVCDPRVPATWGDVNRKRIAEEVAAANEHRIELIRAANNLYATAIQNGDQQLLVQARTALTNSCTEACYEPKPCLNSEEQLAAVPAQKGFKYQVTNNSPGYGPQGAYTGNIF